MPPRINIPPFSMPHKTIKDITVTDWTGKIIFQQAGVEVPSTWSDNAIQIAVSRWFRGKMDTPDREVSIYKMFERVATALVDAGIQYGHYKKQQRKNLIEYLVFLQVDQRFVFNTPVYLNAGWSKDPRCSACFLLAVEDNYESLTKHGLVESKVFQHGGGAGVYIGGISHEGRELGRGGYASGALPFNEGWDRASGAIKSGGSHRRAARDVTMDVRHPDCYRSKEYLASLPVEALDNDFIREKQQYEKLRQDLASLGYDVGMDTLVNYVLPAQNANRAVGVYDSFMKAVEEGDTWDVCCPRSGDRVWTYPAKEVFDALCYASWFAADPTVKFFDTINQYNTCKFGSLTVDGVDYSWEDLSILISNPCIEVMFSVPPVSEALVACNLSMSRLTKYLNPDSLLFDRERYVSDARFMYRAQDVVVDYSDYPTELGKEWTLQNRIIGASISDLGGLLLEKGVSYASEEGRLYAGAIAALHFAACMYESANLAKEMGACANYYPNAKTMQGVLALQKKHLSALATEIKRLCCSSIHAFISVAYDALDEARGLASYAETLWEEAINISAKHGFRNMQFVSYAPQGTTGIITDCSTTGIEPLIALKAYKTLSGGGYMTLTPPVVEEALKRVIERLDDTVQGGWQSLYQSLCEHGTLSKAAGDERGLAYELGEYDDLFRCALGVKKSTGEIALSISPEDHVYMMGMLQRFVSGAISKTVNLPNSATPEDIGKVYMLAWKEGVKAISVYRDGCKGAQPVKLSSSDSKEATAEGVEVLDREEIHALQAQIEYLEQQIKCLELQVSSATPRRKKLQDTTCSVRTKISLGGTELYLHVGLYPDGKVGEVFLTGVQGSFVAGMLDVFATLLSISFQYGVPFEDLYRKFEAVSFAPQGFVAPFGFVSSLPSLVFKILKDGIESGSFVSYAKAFAQGGIKDPQGEVLSGGGGSGINLQEKTAGSPSSVDPASTSPSPSKTITKAPSSPETITGDPCPNCGSLLMQTGRCKTCTSCGYNSGACG